MTKKEECNLSQEISPLDLFKMSRIYAGSAETLCNTKDPLHLIPTGFLLHLSLELFLKGCMSIYNNEYCKTHSLTHLVAIHLKQLSIDAHDMVILEYFDKCHDLRYSLNDIGSNDMDNYYYFIKKIISQSDSIKKEYKSPIYSEVNYKGKKVLALESGKSSRQLLLMQLPETNISGIFNNIHEHFRDLAQFLGHKTLTTKEFTIINSTLKSPIYNIVYDTIIQPKDLRKKIKELIDQFEGQPFTWWVNPVPTERVNLGKNLIKSNFVEEKAKTWILHVANLKIPTPITAMLIKEVGDKKDLVTFFDCLKKAHKIIDELRIPSLSGSSNITKFFIGYVNNKPAAIAMLYCNRKIASVFHLCAKGGKEFEDYRIDMLSYLMKYAQSCRMKYISIMAKESDNMDIYKNFGFGLAKDILCFRSII